MYTLKSIAQRSVTLGAAFALVVAAVAPTAAVFADTLNPLTERSLLLSSSAPGFQNTDGSGSSTDITSVGGTNYAPAGSGPNGAKSGQTFQFRVSSTATVKALTFQYCTTAAGVCQSPGNNTGAVSTSDREVNEGAGNAHANKRSDLDLVGAFTQGAGAGQFQVLINGTPSVETWSFAKANLENHSGPLTGKNNYATLTSSTGNTINAGDRVKIIFSASETAYITNPGEGSFFVKINTYNSDTSQIGAHNDTTPLDEADHTVVDGGVTVANVMTDSIHITTKVLETMQFSVGTRNRDTTELVGPQVHRTCDPIEVIDGNRLQLGNPSAEYSLETDKGYDVNSYWRLSSNSSGGATVYYSGNTLANTVGDEITEIGATAKVSTPGTEQFGLGFVPATEDAVSSSFQAEITAAPLRFKLPTMTADNLAPEAPYADATGTLGSGGAVGTAQFAFKKSSNTVPEVIATNTGNVISCATAKMRYVGNIAADTPAGVYTTKINYLAAPQY